MRAHRVLTLAAALAATALFTTGASAQKGEGTTGSQVVQLPAGARAAALAGAYTAIRGDADVVFYNPAGVSQLFRAAALSYQKHVADINIGSAAAAFRVGPATVAAGIAYLNAGDVAEIVPGTRFPGERGDSTGADVGASESASRLAVGVPLLDGRLHLGAAAGIALSDLAGLSRSAAFFDLGAQLALPYSVTLGASVRNLGGDLSGSGAEPAPLPTEARAGAAVQVRGASDLGLLVTADLISRLKDERTGFAAGAEAGLLPASSERLGAVLRVGYAGDQGEGGVGSLHLGAGVSLSGIWVDYTYQDLDFLGTAHRIGVRWTGARP